MKQNMKNALKNIKRTCMRGLMKKKSWIVKECRLEIRSKPPRESENVMHSLNNTKN